MSGKKKPKKPPIDKKSVQERLRRALDEQLFITLRRWIPDAERTDGFVVALGSTWVALAKVDGVRPDGWCLVRVKDIQAVYVVPDPECLEVRVLEASGQWPLVTPELQLDDTLAALVSAAAAAPLTSVMVEFDRPDIMWIGALTVVDSTTVRLHEVDTQAEWRRKARAIDLEDVTRVEFGGCYEESLALVGGPLPPM